MPSRSLSVSLLASVALVVFAAGCKDYGNAVSQTTVSQATVPVQPVPQPPVIASNAAAPAQPAHGERTLDPQPAPAPPPAPAPTAPVLEAKNRKNAVRTPSDDNLPKWVPVRGRLTVVDSSDLAENLGLVPPGTTKKTDERISVADKLAEQNAARAAHTDPMTAGVSWNYAPAGRFKNHR
jgi:hypothetical protein